MAMHMLRIMLVDDHELVRIGVNALFQGNTACEVVAEARSAQQAVACAQQYSPEVIVMDIRMPGTNGIEATHMVKAILPDTRVIILTSFADNTLLFEGISAGVSGYILKESGGDVLLRALEVVSQGGAMLDPRLTGRVFRRVSAAENETARHVFDALTASELHVLHLVAEGRPNKEIARRLHLSAGTVRNCMCRIMQKLGASNRAGAAAFAIRHHIGQVG
jgi:two-component system response regulator DevR